MNKVIILDSELQHYGITGMKWGIRRANSKTQSLSRKIHATTKRFDRGKDLPEGRVRELSKKYENKNIKSSEK